MITHLRLLDGDFGGFRVDRLTHSLQTATRAYRANRDDDYVACALLHDIGDTLGSFNHPDIGAAIVKPFVGDDLHWMVEKHGIFQGYYFFHFLGLDRDLRDQFAGHPYYDLTAEFCADFDQPSFDPDYPTMTLDDFTPLLQQFFSAAEALDLPPRGVPAQLFGTCDDVAGAKSTNDARPPQASAYVQSGSLRRWRSS